MQIFTGNIITNTNIKCYSINTNIYNVLSLEESSTF